MSTKSTISPIASDATNALAAVVKLNSSGRCGSAWL